MSKIDIRFRRQQFTQGRIQRYKNYGSLMERHRKSHRRKLRGVALLAFILIVLIIVIISFFTETKQGKIEKTLPNTEIQSTSGARTLAS